MIKGCDPWSGFDTLDFSGETDQRGSAAVKVADLYKNSKETGKK